MKLDAENLLVVGCNYHTTWQSNRAMRFILREIKGDRARLVTRNSKKNFWTNVNTLRFIRTRYNFEKAEKLLKEQYEKSLH